jgi:hypothetical protein
MDLESEPMPYPAKESTKMQAGAKMATGCKDTSPRSPRVLFPGVPQSASANRSVGHESIYEMDLLIGSDFKIVNKKDTKS